MPRIAAALLVAGALALGVGGILFYALLPHRLPSDADWRAAAAYLAREARPTDVVVLEPWWAERARQFLPESLPIIDVPALHDDDLLGVDRVWLLALPAAPGSHSDNWSALEARSGAIARPRSFGGIELALRRLRSPVVPLAFVPDRLASAIVTSGETPCMADRRGRFRCAASPNVAVAGQIRDVAYEARRCIVIARAQPGEPQLTLSFPAVPIGRVLRGHAGIAGESAFKANTGARVRVAIDGDEVGIIAPGGPAWNAFEMKTARHAGAARTISFTLLAADALRRDLCFDAYTLP